MEEVEQPFQPHQQSDKWYSFRVFVKTISYLNDSVETKNVLLFFVVVKLSL